MTVLDPPSECSAGEVSSQTKPRKTSLSFQVWLLVGSHFAVTGLLLLVFLYLQNRHHLYPSEHLRVLVWIGNVDHYGALLAAPILWMIWALILSRKVVAPTLQAEGGRRSWSWETLWFLPALGLTLGFLCLFLDPLQKMGILRPYHYPWEYFVGCVVMCPLFEELVYRRVLFAHLTTRTTVLKAALLSSVVFALAHFGSYQPLPWSEFLGGLIFCGLYLWRKSIVAPIAAHMGTNLAWALVEKFMLR